MALWIVAPAVPAAAPGAGSPGEWLVHAVAAAAPGVTLVVAPGVYRVNLVIRKPLVLRGEAGAVLDGGGAGDVIRIRAPDVTVEGFTIRHSGRDLTTMDAGIFVERRAANAVIRNNVIEDDLFGVRLGGCEAPRVIGNTVRGIRALRSPDRGDGIHLWNVHHGVIADNDIAYARDGIYIYVSDHDVIRGNTIHDLRYGVHYMFSNHNELIDNHTYDTRAGYALMESNHLLIRGNVSTGDRNYGILMNYITYSDITGNRVIGVKSGVGYATGGAAVVGAQGKALFAYNCVYDDIHGNLFADSEIGLHLTAGSEYNRIYGNAFVDNRAQVRYGNNRAEEWSHDGRGNYWSDYLGWDLNGDGIGDVPYVPNDAMDRLLWIYPAARLLMNSPAVETLRWVQREFPVLVPPHVQDSHPLMRPPLPLPTPAEKGIAGVRE